MTVLPLLAVGIVMKFVAVLFVLVCIILILVVLMQKGRGGGLSGAFGGGMASGLLGSKTGDFLTWVTIVLVSVFLFLAVLLARYYKPSTKFGAAPPATAQTTQPAPAGQPAATPPAAGEQSAPTAPAATPPAGSAQPAAAPAGQSTPEQPGAASQPTPPAAETGKTGG